MIDQIRFFAGAARVLEGRASGEYMSGFTSMIRRDPIGVVASIVLDNYGWVGFEVHPASLWRVLGAALMIVGVGMVAFT